MDKEHEFEIESDVEVYPIGRTSTGRRRIYPFDKMEVNDSFAIKAETGTPEELKKIVRRVTSAVTYFKKHENSTRTFTVRKNDELNEVRIWRLG